jgi:hypothetical protein
MGIPSPRKLFWVISIKGAYVRFEGVRIAQLPKGPTPFETDTAAKNASRHIHVGEIHYVVLQRKSRAWLESVARGETPVNVQIYLPER